MPQTLDEILGVEPYEIEDPKEFGYFTEFYGGSRQDHREHNPFNDAAYMLKAEVNEPSYHSIVTVDLWMVLKNDSGDYLMSFTMTETSKQGTVPEHVKHNGMKYFFHRKAQKPIIHKRIVTAILEPPSSQQEYGELVLKAAEVLVCEYMARYGQKPGPAPIETLVFTQLAKMLD